MNATSIKNRRAGGAPPCEDLRKLGLTSVSVARELGVSPSSVSKSIVRGQQALRNEAIEEYLLEGQ